MLNYFLLRRLPTRWFYYSPIVRMTLLSGRVLLDDSLSSCESIFVVFRHRGELALRYHVHHLVAAGLELADQFRHRPGGVVLEIVVDAPQAQ